MRAACGILVPDSVGIAVNVEKTDVPFAYSAEKHRLWFRPGKRALPDARVGLNQNAL